MAAGLRNAAPATVAEEIGDVDAALPSADRVFEADYVFPYLAHAALEPMDGAIELRDGAAEIWSGMQIPTISQGTMAGVLGMPPASIAINTMYAGAALAGGPHPPANLPLNWLRSQRPAAMACTNSCGPVRMT